MNALPLSPALSPFLQSEGLMAIVPWIVIGAVFVFLVVLPARRERKAKDLMIANLKKGDRVLTQAGIIGRIARLEDGDVMVLDFEGTKIQVLRSSVVRLYEQKTEAAGKS